MLSLTNTRVKRAWPACHCHSLLLHFRPASPCIQVTKSVGGIRRKKLWLVIWHPKMERTHSASAWGPSSCSMSVMLAVYCRCASRSKRGETSETGPKCWNAWQKWCFAEVKGISAQQHLRGKVLWVWSFANPNLFAHPGSSRSVGSRYNRFSAEHDIMTYHMNSY